ncbi:TPA: hypothetical protein ACGSG6_004207 [Escherichia coli]
MNADTWTRLQAFRHALELTSCEASLTAGYDHLKDFPAGCSELASQTLTDYLTEDGSNLYSCIVGMQWDNGPGRYGHVIAAPARDYIDLTLDQFRTTAAWRLQIVVWQNMSFQSNHPE